LTPATLCQPGKSAVFPSGLRHRLFSFSPTQRTNTSTAREAKGAPAPPAPESPGPLNSQAGKHLASRPARPRCEGASMQGRRPRPAGRPARTHTHTRAICARPRRHTRILLRSLSLSSLPLLLSFFLFLLFLALALQISGSSPASGAEPASRPRRPIVRLPQFDWPSITKCPPPHTHTHFVSQLTQRPPTNPTPDDHPALASRKRRRVRCSRPADSLAPSPPPNTDRPVSVPVPAPPPMLRAGILCTVSRILEKIEPYACACARAFVRARQKPKKASD
jgi:hypothetical protein